MLSENHLRFESNIDNFKELDQLAREVNSNNNYFAAVSPPEQLTLPALNVEPQESEFPEQEDTTADTSPLWISDANSSIGASWNPRDEDGSLGSDIHHDYAM